MFLPLDGPSLQDSLAISTTEVEAKIGASAFDGRKVVTIQPQDGQVRVTFVSGTPASEGILVFKYQTMSFEASEQQPIYLITETGTTNVVVIERA